MGAGSTLDGVAGGHVGPGSAVDGLPGGHVGPRGAMDGAPDDRAAGPCGYDQSGEHGGRVRGAVRHRTGRLRVRGAHLAAGRGGTHDGEEIVVCLFLLLKHHVCAVIHVCNVCLMSSCH